MRALCHSPVPKRGCLLFAAAAAYWLADSAGAAADAAAPFFFLLFFGFFTCFSVGGEYELTALEPPGAAGCASATEAPAASETAVNNSVSFFIRFSPLTVAIWMSRRVLAAPDRVKADSVYKAENSAGGNIQPFGADIVGAPHRVMRRPARCPVMPCAAAYSSGANARSASVFDSAMRCA